MLINIQFLRFVAALMVVLFHASAHLRASGHSPSGIFAFGQSVGFAGVDIFFVISGFIMAWTTHNASGGAEAVSFAKRRVARIYSGYWPFFLLALVYYAVVGGNYLSNVHFLGSALLWPTELRHLLIPVSWTLIYEMVFYLLFTVLVAFAAASRTRIIIGVIIAVSAWSLYSYLGRHAYDRGVLESMNVYEQYLAFPFILEFLSGSILAAWLRKHPRGMAWSLLLTGILLLGASGWVNNKLFGGMLIQGYYIIWRVLFFGVAALFILAGMVRLENQGWTLARRFSVLAGGASYALYLCHTLILDATYKMGLNSWLRQYPDWAAQSAFIGLSALIVLYSMAHFRWVERPLHRLFRRLLKA